LADPETRDDFFHELIHEVLVAYYFGKLPEITYPKTYFGQWVRWRWINFQQRNRKRQHQECSLSEYDETEKRSDVPEALTVADPFHHVFESELWVLFEEITIQALSPMEAIVLRKIGKEGLSLKETAQFLNITSPAVSKILYRARRKLLASPKLRDIIT
jgi:RNA polymerase sigma factor (sigma-70 family)